MLIEEFMDKAIGPLIGGVAGATVALVTNHITNYLNFRLNRNDDRVKSLNLALYHLMRVHRYAEFKLQSSPEKVFDKYIKNLCETNGLSDEEIDHAQAENSNIKTIIRQRYEKELEDLNNCSLEEELLKAVYELSKVEPELAHTIAIRSSWQNSVKGSDDYIKEVLSNIAVDGIEREIVQRFAEKHLMATKDTILQDQRDDLLSVAQCISRKKHKQIKQHIERVKEYASADRQVKLMLEEAQSNFDEVINEFVNTVAANRAKKEE